MIWLHVALAVAFAVLLPATTADAQPAALVHRIGVLGNQNLSPWNEFRKRLNDLGYVDGRNAKVDWYWSEGHTDRLPALARQMVAHGPDVIVASGTQAVRAAMRATTTVPIVMATSAYPDKLGLVQSLARPGGNVTGLSNLAPDLMAKKLELLKEIAPKVSRVAVIWNPASEVEPLGFGEVLAAAKAAGTSIDSIEVRNRDDFEAAFATVAAKGVDALLVFGNPVNFSGRQRIADFAFAQRLPTIFLSRVFVEPGGLMSYGPSFAEMFGRAATYVDKILKGAKPADLPVEQPIKYALVINRRTATALGLTIPASLLLRADQIIE